MQPEKLVVSLISAGELIGGLPLPSGFQVISSQAELNALYARIPESAVPDAYKSPDFTRTDLFYLEGAGDNSPLSAVRILEAEKNSRGSTTVFAEKCGGGIVFIPNHTPFALYATPKLGSATVLSWTFADLPACAGVKKVEFSRIAVGALVRSGAGVGPAIRNQADLNAVLARIPADSVPTEFIAPDFSKVNLVFVHRISDSDPASYVRIVNVYQNVDNSYDISAEYCGYFTDFNSSHTPYSLYATAPLVGDARLETVIRRPDVGCVTTR